MVQAQAKSKPNVLEVKGLKVHFPTREGRVRAVNGVDLSLQAGKTLGVVGESGCGKSITARAILRIVPEPGEIVAGQILLRRPGGQLTALETLPAKGPEMRTIRGKEIGMIFQEPMSSLSPVHTIGNQISESLRLHLNMSRREAIARTIELLDLVGIPSPGQRVHTYPFQLSGGMRQRAMIAMALACEPSILLADEPTTALDVTVQAQILDLLTRLQDELGMSTMLITHNLGVVGKTCHHVAVMYMGRVVESGPTRSILDHPLHPYTRGLLRSVPRIGSGGRRRPLIPIKGTVPGPHVKIEGCPFHPRCPDKIEGLCDQFMPAQVEVEQGRLVRCFLHSEAVEQSDVVEDIQSIEDDTTSAEKSPPNRPISADPVAAETGQGETSSKGGRAK